MYFSVPLLQPVLPVVVSCRADQKLMLIVCSGGKSHIWDTFSLVNNHLVVVLPGGGVLHLHHRVTGQHGQDSQLGRIRSLGMKTEGFTAALCLL